MAVNKRKVLDAARKYAQKGAKEKALKEYNRLLKLDPRDAKLHLEIGDTYRRWGQLDEAIAQYTRVAEQYQQEGFDARAVAVFKQILNLDPKRYATFVSLSELYQHMGLASEAIGALQTAADGYHKEGQRREALELLRRMAALDPTNTTSRMKVAELLRQEGLEEDAVSEYSGVAEELLREGAIDSLASVYERILEIQPERVDVLIAISRNLIELKNPERAEPFARRALAKAPDKPEHYELLCDVYKALGRVEELIDVTRSLAKLHRERGDEERAREVIQRLPAGESLDPEEQPEIELEESAAEESFGEQFDLSDPGQSPDEFEVADDELLEDDEFFESGADVVEFDLDSEADLSSPDTSEPLIEVDASSPALDLGASAPEVAVADVSELPEADPDQLLAEASVYLRYGKTGQAIASLKAVIARDPGHRAALEKLGEAYAESGEAESAIEVWTSAAMRAGEQGDASAVALLRDRVAALDPAAAAAIVVAEVPGDALEEEIELDVSAPDLEADLGADLDDIDLSTPDLDDSLADGAAPAEASSGDLAAASDDFGADEIDIEIDASDFDDDSLLEGDSDFEVEIDLDADVLAEAPGEGSVEGAGAQTEPSLPLEAEVAAAEQDVASPLEADLDDELLGDPEPDAAELGGDAAEVTSDSLGDIEDIEIGLDTDELDLACEEQDAGTDVSESAEAEPGETTFSSDLADDDSQSSASMSSNSANAHQVSEDLEEGEFYFRQGLYDEAEAIYQRILAVAPNHPSAMLRMGELATARGEDPSAVAVAASADTPAVEVASGTDEVALEFDVDIAPDASTDEPESEVDEALELSPDASTDEPELEVSEDTDTAEAEDADGATDQMIEAEAPELSAQELAEVAEPIEAQALAAESDEQDPEVEVEEPEAEAAASSSLEKEVSEEQTLPMGDATAEAEEAGTFDFAAELRDELEEDDERAESGNDLSGSTADVAFESVFNDFKKGVSETLSDGDFETRYDLGIAYREMELYDDAIGEFSRCLESPERRLDSLCMMALCALDLSRGTDAVSHLEQALAMPELEDARRAGIQFDLGRAFKSLGETDRARESFESVIAFEAGFPGAAEALASLGAPEPGSDEGAGFVERGESFDDLIAEAEADDEEAEAPVAEANEVFESFDDLVTEDPDLEPPASAPAPAPEPQRDGAGDSSDNKIARKKKKKISFV